MSASLEDDGLDKGAILPFVMLEAFDCPECGASFPSKRGRANHIRVHTGLSKISAQKMSETRIATGVAKGSRNPNSGNKTRPWLIGDNNPLRQWHRTNPGFGERQIGDANPIHKVLHLYEIDDYLFKITSGLKAHAALKKGSTYEEIYGVEKAAEYKRKLRDASPSRLSKFFRKETGPEKIVRKILEDLHLPFQSQAAIGFYTVDFLVGSTLVIEADGDYWHGNPVKFPDLSDLQKKNRRLDASEDTYLLRRGYQVLRLWESDLNRDPDGCANRIEEAFNVKVEEGSDVKDK